MSNLSIAYIFQQQQLLVDQDFQLPQVERLHNDLALSSDHKVIARDLFENETNPYPWTSFYEDNDSLNGTLTCVSIVLHCFFGLIVGRYFLTKLVVTGLINPYIINCIRISQSKECL